jgi:hypothetical protein
MAARVDERQAGRPPVRAAFAAFWLVRASLAIGGRAGDVLLAVSGVAVIGVFAYAITVTADTAPRPAGPQARRIERSGWRIPPGQANGAPGARCVLLPDGHDSLAGGGWELGRGLGDAASGVPATAQCR